MSQFFGFFQCFPFVSLNLSSSSGFSLHQVATLPLSPSPDTPSGVPGGEDPAAGPLLRPLPWSKKQYLSSDKYSMSINCAPSTGLGPGTQGKPFLESSDPSTLALGKWDEKGTSA